MKVRRQEIHPCPVQLKRVGVRQLGRLVAPKVDKISGYRKQLGRPGPVYFQHDDDFKVTAMLRA
eukprot:5738518-Alexandrium_andersonii.AAC.1